MLNNPKLPKADPWDRQTGLRYISFTVECNWIPLTSDWALLQPTILLDDKAYFLSKDVEVARVYSENSTGKVEAPWLTAAAWMKKALRSGGVTSLGLLDGEFREHKNGKVSFKWTARVGSKLSVAVVKLDGNLTGHVRLVPVE